MSTDAANMAEQAAALCRRVAPADLEGRPLYVVLTSTLPADLRDTVATGVCFGLTSPTFDFWLRDFVPWEGRGPAMLIDDLSIQAHFPRCDLAEEVCAVSLHELAHILAHGYMWDAPPAEHHEAPGFSARIFKVAGVHLAELPADPTGDPGHCPLHWLRVVIHLAHRCRVAGHRLSAQRIAGRPMCYSYVSALAEEVKKCEALPLCKVLKLSIPDDYLQVWAEEKAIDAAVALESKDSPSEKTDTTSQTVKDRDMNAVQSILSKLLGKANEQRKSAHDQYQAAVVAVADGTEPDGLEGVLAAAGKSAEDLAAAVKLCLDRRGWRAEVAAADGATQELEKAEARVEQLRQTMIQAVEAANRPYDEAVEPLRALRARCRSLKSLAERAAQKLAESAAPSADLGEKKAAAEKRLAALRAKAGEVNHEVRNSEFIVEQVQAKEYQFKSGMVPQSEKDTYAAKRAEVIANAEAAKTKDAQIRRHIAEAEREAAAAEAEMRERQLAAV